MDVATDAGPRDAPLVGDVTPDTLSPQDTTVLDAALDAVEPPPDAATDSGASPDVPTGPPRTRAGVPLPTGWALRASDRFGTAASQTIGTMAALHANYYEGLYYTRDAAGLVRFPNVVINNEQQTYVHFEDAVVFASDHLTIQVRGHADHTITSGEIVSRRSQRSFCVEARYRTPATDRSWPAFWFYGDDPSHDSSEIDVEQPITPNQGVHDISMFNHPDATSVTIVDSHFTTQWMTWTSASFDASTAPHSYTSCYDDATATITRYLDGNEIYSAAWRWNASLGGTGHGPDASAIVNVAVGGNWPGNVSAGAIPSYSADLDLYFVEYYGP